MQNDAKVAKIGGIVRRINQLFLERMYDIYYEYGESFRSSIFTFGLNFNENKNYLYKNKNYYLYKNKNYLYENKPGSINMSLLFIYEYEKLNEMGRAIISESGAGSKKWYRDYSIEDFKNKEVKSKASFDFIDECSNFNLEDRYCNELNDFDANTVAPTHNREIYIFWALLILAVDKMDAEKNLESICDFAHAFGFSKNILEYISYVVKVVCEGHLSEFKGRIDEKYKNEDNLEIFDDILKNYGNYHFDELNEEEISEDIL